MTPYYEADGVTIYNADCADVLPTIDPADVALVLTDPPYGISLDTEWAPTDTKRHYSGQHNYIRVAGDDHPFDPTLLLTRYRRVALFGANHFAPMLPVGQWIVWHKIDASPLMAAAELLWHNCGGRPVGYYSTTKTLARRRDGALHPTQKPVSLMHWCLDRLGVKAGDLVLDPYMGSGPVARACADMGLRYIGVEIVEDYCRIAVDRLRQ